MAQEQGDWREHTGCFGCLSSLTVSRQPGGQWISVPGEMLSSGGPEGSGWERGRAGGGTWGTRRWRLGWEWWEEEGKKQREDVDS